MRVVLIILIMAVVLLILLVQSGFLTVDQTRGAQLPRVEANGVGVTASGGQAPAFEVETGSLAVGARPENVQVQLPTVRVIPPAQAGNVQANAAQ